MVARMVRVHEAVGSTPATRTIGESFQDSPIFYCAFVKFWILLRGNEQLLVIWGYIFIGIILRDILIHSRQSTIRMEHRNSKNMEDFVL